MPKKTDTARSFVLDTLRQHPDREMQVSDLHDLCQGKFNKDNLANLMPKLVTEGLVVKTAEGRAAWWAIAKV